MRVKIYFQQKKKEEMNAEKNQWSFYIKNRVASLKNHKIFLVRGSSNYIYEY